MWTWPSTHECARDTSFHAAASTPSHHGVRLDTVVVHRAVGGIVNMITSIGIDISAKPPLRHLKALPIDSRIPSDIPRPNTNTNPNPMSIRSRARHNRKATLALIAPMTHPRRRTLIPHPFRNSFHAGLVFRAAVTLVRVADGALAGGFRPSLAGLVVQQTRVGVGLTLEFAEDGVFVLEEVADEFVGVFLVHGDGVAGFGAEDAGREGGG